MPQLSPMMGVAVFVLTNLSFMTLLLSVRSMFNVSPVFKNSSQQSGKAFRSFS